MDLCKATCDHVRGSIVEILIRTGARAMRTTHQGLRGVIYLLAMLAVLAAGIASMQFAPALHATASHDVSHSQLALNCPSAYSHC
jgi:hypothetical protein